jgi:hypothetical protein
MSPLTRLPALTAPVVRPIAIAALLGATFFASLLTVAHAAPAPGATFQLAAADTQRSEAAVGATATKGETVEQRISSLHTALKITPDEETKWNDVAQAMRDNSAAMQKLAAEKTTVAPASMTAVDDLTAYEKFAQAHVDGLKNLISSFTTLYNSIPDPQKKLADEVFETFGRKGAPGTHS